LSFVLAYDLIVVNILFRKRVSHLVTFTSGQHCSQIDFILVRREDRHACLDCKVIPGGCVVPQHKHMVAVLWSNHQKLSKSNGKGKRAQTRERKVTLRARQIVTTPTPSPGCLCRVIVEGQGSYYMP
jgi:hypothetical protein